MPVAGSYAPILPSGSVVAMVFGGVTGAISDAVDAVDAPWAVVVVTSPAAVETVLVPFKAVVVISPVGEIVGASARPTLLGGIVPLETPFAISLDTVVGFTPALVNSSAVNVPLLAELSSDGLVTPTANNAATPTVAHPPGM